ncbi:MAG: hypothetical protein JNM97_21635 [Rhodoferax sp.]|jgi:hypothetical protein|nr:hypothetical protein [Rhodoferax sp.]
MPTMHPCRHLLLATLLAACAGPAAAAWVKVAEASGSTIYLDPAVSRKVGDNIMVWLLRDHAAMRFGTGGPYWSSRDQIEIDCRARRVRRIYASDHPKPMGEGKFVASEHGPMSWNDAQPRSIMGRVVELACNVP